MRQQPIPRDSWTEAQAVRLVRGLSSGQNHAWTGGNGDAFGPDVAEREADASRRAALTRAVEDEVIPRLLMARRPQRSARAAAEAQQQEADRIANLVAIVLAGTQSEATAYVEALRDGGSNTESLFLDLLAPTARELGRLWEEDLTTCADVTLGLVRLANIMRLLAGPFTGDTAAQHAGSPVLLAQMPGEQHGLGLAMVAHFFRRAGWCVQEERAASSADLIGIVHRNWFGLIGISVSCTDRLQQLAIDIRAIRRQSRNRDIGVLVGGPPFMSDPQLALLVGADATACDARQAVSQAQSLISLLAADR
jgi:methanogenic corrinoid protein MtbC1